jgi:hypothetical protein
MLKALRDHPLLGGTAEVLAAAVRYMLVLTVLLGHLAKVAL